MSTHVRSMFLSRMQNRIAKVVFNACTRDDQKVLDPLHFGLPGNEKLTNPFQYKLLSRQCT